MKKIMQLHINSNKILNNEELISFKGGNQGATSHWECYVICSDYSDNDFHFASTCDQENIACAMNECIMFHNQIFHNCTCVCDLGLE
jgi:hypothetical protein